jgi:hypothetical protein
VVGDELIVSLLKLGFQRRSPLTKGAAAPKGEHHHAARSGVMKLGIA